MDSICVSHSVSLSAAGFRLSSVVIVCFGNLIGRWHQSVKDQRKTSLFSAQFFDVYLLSWKGVNSHYNGCNGDVALWIYITCWMGSPCMQGVGYLQNQRWRNLNLWFRYLTVIIQSVVSRHHYNICIQYFSHGKDARDIPS